MQSARRSRCYLARVHGYHARRSLISLELRCHMLLSCQPVVDVVMRNYKPAVPDLARPWMPHKPQIYARISSLLLSLPLLLLASDSGETEVATSPTPSTAARGTINTACLCSMWAFALQPQATPEQDAEASTLPTSTMWSWCCP